MKKKKEDKAEVEQKDNKEIVSFVAAHKTQALDARKTIEKVWDECFKLSRNEHDFSGKEDWQFKVAIPESKAAIQKAVSLIRSALIKVADYFKVTGGGQPEIMEKRITYWLDKVNFLVTFMEAIESGFTYGVGILKFYPKVSTITKYEAVQKEELVVEPNTKVPIPTKKIVIEEVSKEIIEPVFEACDPKLTYFLPNNYGAGIAEESVKTMTELEELKETSGYDKDEIDKLLKEDYGDSASEEVKKRLKELKISDNQNQYRRECVLIQYCGVITDSKGKVIHKNCRTVVANGKYVIYPPQEIKTWSGDPYIIFSPLRVIFRKMGEGLIESVRSIARAINELTMLQLDALLYELLGIMEIDPSKLLNPAEARSIEPGKPLRRSPSASPGASVTIDRPKPFSQASLHIGELLRRSHQTGTRITDILMGLPTIQGREATATEITNKGGESNQGFQTIAMDIEDMALVHCIEKMCSFILQYDTFDEVDDDALIPLANMTREQRMMFLQGDYKFKARGITAFFEMKEQFSEIIKYLEVIAKIPPALATIKWDVINKKLLENTFIHDVAEFIKTPEEMQQDKIEQERLDQQKMQMEMGQKAEALKFQQMQSGVAAQQKLQQGDVKFNQKMQQSGQKHQQKMGQTVEDHKLDIVKKINEIQMAKQKANAVPRGARQ